MSTDALELALALHKAPVQRFSVRDRPLPENIGLVLQLASGAQPQLAEAAERFYESEETIVEAVRFYLQQVLFEPGTDAYRILGLNPDDDNKTVREHHVWLQRWLHPDRSGENWESVFATRLNWAWQQLRNTKSREEYDRIRVVDVHEEGGESHDSAPLHAPAWNVAPAHGVRRHRLRAFAIGGLLVVCLGLFFLAVTREDGVDAIGLSEHSTEADASVQLTMPPAAQTRLPATDTLVTGRNVGSAAQDDAVRIESGAVPQSADAQSNRLARTSNPNGVWEGTSGMRVQERIESAGSTNMPVPPQPEQAIVEKSPPSTEGHQTSQSKSLNLGRVPQSRLAQRSGKAQIDSDASVDPLTGDEAGKAVVVEQASISNMSDHKGAASDSRRTALQVLEADPGTGEETLQRFELARARVSSMVDYFRSPAIRMPDWNDEHGRISADRERSALYARTNKTNAQRFALDRPTWQFSESTVALQATYHVDTQRASAETGQLHLDMAWRDGSWKITRIEVSPSP